MVDGVDLSWTYPIAPEDCLRVATETPGLDPAVAFEFGHLGRTCRALGNFGLLSCDFGDRIMSCPFYVRLHDLADFFGFPPGRINPLTTCSILFLGLPYDQPFNSATKLLSEVSRAGRLLAFQEALRRVLAELGCEGLIGMATPADLEAGGLWLWEQIYPEAKLLVRSPTIEDFIRNLGPGSRSNFGRRLRRIRDDDLRVDTLGATEASQLLDQLYECYERSYERATVKWLQMPKSFFTPSPWTERSATYLVARRGTHVVGFALMVDRRPDWLNYRMGMADDRAANEYFALLFRSYELAVERKYDSIWLGPTAYETKFRLQASFHERRMFFDLLDPELRKWFSMAAKSVYGNIHRELRKWQRPDSLDR
ncbi:MAG: hypothetical protein HY791_27895 [Deltaproteobacteria bacterium]|nr:hypothetical protein [Deltaproteobacteria bacterium]